MTHIFEFDLSENNKFKGVLSAIVDNREMFADTGIIPPKEYIIEAFGIIWVDKNDEWQMRVRLKFPSGNKQSFANNYGKDANETLVLHDIYKLPMYYKHWFPNPTGTFEALLQIMKDNDLIEWSRMEIKA